MLRLIPRAGSPVPTRCRSRPVEHAAERVFEVVLGTRRVMLTSPRDEAVGRVVLADFDALPAVAAPVRALTSLIAALPSGVRARPSMMPGDHTSSSVA